MHALPPLPLLETFSSLISSSFLSIRFFELYLPLVSLFLLFVCKVRSCELILTSLFTFSSDRHKKSYPRARILVISTHERV